MTLNQVSNSVRKLESDWMRARPAQINGHENHLNCSRYCLFDNAKTIKVWQMQSPGSYELCECQCKCLQPISGGMEREGGGGPALQWDLQIDLCPTSLAS